MKQTIWLCRHGNRIDFVDPSWSGDNPHLSDDGVIQAKETGIRLQGEGIKHIFASPFLRAVETASHIANALNMKVKVEHGVSEWLNQDWFIETPKHISLVDLNNRFSNIDMGYKSILIPSFPETDEESLARAGKAACQLANKNQGDILIIGHGHSVVGMAYGLVEYGCNVSPGLCSLVKIVYQNGSGEIILNGDSSHLSTGKKHQNKFN